MRMQRTLPMLCLLGALSSACSDRDDDPFEPTTSGDLPATTPDAATADATVPAQMDATVGADAGATLIDASLNPEAGPSGGDAAVVAEREHDTRSFSFDPAAQMSPFDAIPGVETDRWTGVLDGAGYRIEVPKAWNGTLVMYAHGYGGTGSALNVSTPSIRRHLIENGFAWAASSYSANYYDVRAGVEDTNKLALAFGRISAENGRPLDATKKYIIGHSMGGHVAGAAVERETIGTAINSVRYAAALPMCGVMGDTELFNYFAAYQFAAHQLAGVPVTMLPANEYAAVRTQLQAALFTMFPAATTPAGDKLKSIVMNLTGGARPVFDLGWVNPIQTTVWGTFGGDGKINGILNKSVTDTRAIEYQLDSDPALSEEERAFNAQVYRATPEPDANPRRSASVRWIPVINGEFDVPVLSIHTLGDMYVPFSMQQIYRRRANAKGNADRLVQRAIRGAGHCEFSYAEQVQAFDALVAWEERGEKPAGDDVLDPAVVASPSYGCAFTTVPNADDRPTLATARMAVPACPAPTAPPPPPAPPITP